MGRSVFVVRSSCVRVRRNIRFAGSVATSPGKYLVAIM
jgi:hypothetical protein